MLVLGELRERVIGCAIDVHKRLGPGALRVNALAPPHRGKNISVNT
jgi:hypothetical protein